MPRIVTLLRVLCCPVMSLADTALRANQQRIEQRILALATHGKNPEGGVSRIAFSQADINGRQYLRRLVEQAGLPERANGD